MNNKAQLIISTGWTLSGSGDENWSSSHIADLTSLSLKAKSLKLLKQLILVKEKSRFV